MDTDTEQIVTTGQKVFSSASASAMISMIRFWRSDPICILIRRRSDHLASPPRSTLARFSITIILMIASWAANSNKTTISTKTMFFLQEGHFLSVPQQPITASSSAETLTDNTITAPGTPTLQPTTPTTAPYHKEIRWAVEGLEGLPF